MKRRNFIMGALGSALALVTGKAVASQGSGVPLLPQRRISAEELAKWALPGRHWNANHQMFRRNWSRIKVGDFVHVDKSYSDGEYKLYVVTKAHPEHLTLERQKKNGYREEVRTYQHDDLN